jgi:hypothetical protein
MKPLFQKQTSEPTPAELVAEALLDGTNAGLADRVNRMKNLWETLWENPRATPAEILAELGTKAFTLFQAAGAGVADLETLAKLMGTNAEELLGDVKYLSAAAPVNFNPDGTVTLK